MTVSWLFEIGTTYKWSTGDVPYSGNRYEKKVIKDTFDGVTMQCNLDGYLFSPTELEFEISNPNNVITRSDLEGQIGTIRKIRNGRQSRAFRFKILHAVPHYQKMTITCIDILQAVLDGTWPNTPHPKEIWPSDDIDPDDLDDACVPVILGTAYIPVMNVNTGTERFSVLGNDTSITYTVEEMTDPHDWPGISVYDAGDYSFPQTDDSGYKLIQFLTHDSDGDEIADANMLWRSGKGQLPPLVKFSRSDTASLTSPEQWIEYILKDFGVAAADIDTGTGSSFEAAGTIYASRGITFNGGFWKKEDRESLLIGLLRQCDSMLVVTDKIELHPFDKASVETILNEDVKELSYSPAPLTPSTNDGGRVVWPEADKPQDVFPGKAVVPTYTAQSTISKPDGNAFTYRFGSDSAVAQDAAVLTFAKRFLGRDRISFQTTSSKLSCVDTILPWQVITLNGTNFGASFGIVIESISFKYDDTIEIEGVRPEYLEDWDDMASSVLTITGDSRSGYRVAVVGASGVLDEDVNWSQVQDDDGGLPEPNADVTSDHAGNLVDNPGFEAGDTGWSVALPDNPSAEALGWSIVSGNQLTGTYCAEHDGTEGAGRFNSILTPTGAGERFLAQAWIKADAGFDGTFLAYVRFYSQGPTYLAHTTIAIETDLTNSWQHFRKVAVAPAGTVLVGFSMRRIGTPTVGKVYVDNVGLIPMSQIEDSVPYITVGPSTDPSALYNTIADAIDAVTANTAGIYIKNGTYSIGSAISLPDYDIDIIGESKGGVIIQVSSGVKCFERVGSTSKTFKFKNLTITWAATTSYAFDFNEGAFNLIINNCVTNGAIGVNGYPGPYPRDATVVIENTDLVKSGGTGNGFYFCFLRRLQITNCSVTGYKDPFTLYDTEIVVCDGNAFTGNVNGPDIDGNQVGEHFSFLNNVIICDVEGLYSIYGLELVEYDYAKVCNNTITIINTRVSTTTYDVIGIRATIADGFVSNNSIYIDTPHVGGVVGVHLILGEKVAVIANSMKIDAPDSDGIIGISTSHDRCILSDNQIDLVNNTALEIGISLSAMSSNCFGTGNITYNCGTSIDNNGTGNNVTAQDV